MSTHPDQIRQDIDHTRGELSGDVDALAYKASPRRMVHDRKQSASQAVRRVTDKVMGTASHAGHASGSAASATADKASNAASTVGDAASTVGGAAKAAPAQLKRQAEGNPIAAGLIVFAGAWLVSSLLPASQREQRAAGQVKSAVQDHSDTIKEHVGDVAHDMGDNLREPARQAAQSVKSTAQDGAQTVKDDARSAATHVKQETQHAREEIRS
ncbi:DUF3618 domain-containing protein [Phytohabitans houttuyneae]|uniref:DUF3618 domain-containing protein n=1 Tax=Phytohabitans houttuyneae TaxID=1076126 RepID=A0A6V8KMW5_9ACTN|nr:DUF3618 domain-containing protein [Phytohabitans houttuyneae]GFJ83878.1 hypothetical protein Phou_080580 [Phytohabitans houttuyneae]